MECVECDAEITHEESETKLEATMQHFAEEHGYFSTAED